jgi:hypothetical protein
MLTCPSAEFKLSLCSSRRSSYAFALQSQQSLRGWVVLSVQHGGHVERETCLFSYHIIFIILFYFLLHLFLLSVSFFSKVLLLLVFFLIFWSDSSPFPLIQRSQKRLLGVSWIQHAQNRSRGVRWIHQAQNRFCTVLWAQRAQNSSQ